MKAKGGRSRFLTRSYARVSILAAVGVVALLVGTAAATPVAAGTTTVTYVAPYSGTEYTVLILEPTGCGLGVSLPVLPLFDLTDGVALESAGATAHSCGSANSTLYVEAAAGVTSGTFTTKAGAHHLTANWDLDLSARLSVTHGSSGSARAEFAVFFEFLLFDRTSGTTMYQNSYPDLYDIITSGTYSHSYPQVSESVYLNATLDKGHSYAFEAVALIVVTVFVKDVSSSASASVNLGSGSKGATLTSVTDEW